MLLMVFLSSIALADTHFCKSIPKIDRPESAIDFNSIEFIFSYENGAMIPYLLKNLDAGTEAELGIASFNRFVALPKPMEKMAKSFDVGEVTGMSRDMGTATDEALDFEVILTPKDNSFKGHFLFHRANGEIIKVCMACTLMDPVYLK